jgi:hypothetical protein
MVISQQCMRERKISADLEFNLDELGFVFNLGKDKVYLHVHLAQCYTTFYGRNLRIFVIR